MNTKQIQIHDSEYKYLYGLILVSFNINGEALYFNLHTITLKAGGFII